MSPADFAAAQSRILARRATSADLSQAPPPAPTLPPALLRLPPALRTVAASSLSTYNTLAHRASHAPTPYFRVGQVDAELLDEELLSLLKGQVSEALKYYGGHLVDDWSAEISALLHAVVWKLSIWDRGTSYGASLQGLGYVDARSERGQKRGTVSGLAQEATKWQRAAYGLVTVGGRYGWQRLEDWLLDKEGGYEDPSPLVKTIGKLTNWASTTHEFAALASFLVFLYNGKYRTLADRVLSMRLAPTNAQTSREVSFEYLNRQLVWHAFTEFLLFLLPLVGIARWRRWLARAWRKVKSTLSRKTDEDDHGAGGELGFLPERTCAICYRDQNVIADGSEAEAMAQNAGRDVGGGGVIGSAQTDITNPYEAIPCGCIYCFVCLAKRIESEEGEGWTCLRCGELVKECKPWNGDVLEEEVKQRKPDTGRSRSSSSNSRPGSRASRKSVVFVDQEPELERKLSMVDPMPIQDGDETIEQHTRESGEAEQEDFDESNEWDQGESELEYASEGDYEEQEMEDYE